jgi:hypothetical protein
MRIKLQQRGWKELDEGRMGFRLEFHYFQKVNSSKIPVKACDLFDSVAIAGRSY